MSLQPCIDSLQQRLKALEVQLKDSNDRTKELTVKVGIESEKATEIQALISSTKDAVEALVSLQKSKKDKSNDTDQSKKIVKKRGPANSGY